MFFPESWCWLCDVRFRKFFCVRILNESSSRFFFSSWVPPYLLTTLGVLYSSVPDADELVFFFSIDGLFWRLSRNNFGRIVKTPPLLFHIFPLFNLNIHRNLCYKSNSVPAIFPKKRKSPKIKNKDRYIGAGTELKID